MFTLLEKNISYWSKKTGGVLRVNAEELVKKIHLIRDQNNTVVDCSIDGSLLYKKPVNELIKTQLDEFSKMPSKLLVSAPSIKSEIGVTPRVTYESQESANHLDLIKPYIDQPTDDHQDRFRNYFYNKINDEGIEIAAKPKKEEAYYLVVFGVGLGLHLEELIAKYKPRHLILIENNLNNFLPSFLLVDWQALINKKGENNTQVTLHLSNEPSILNYKIISSIQKDSLSGLDGLIGYLHRDEPAFKIAMSDLHSHKSSNIPSFIGFIPDEYNMTRNSFLNLASGNQKILTKRLKKISKPVMIVGSGPSLEKNIDQLKTIRDSFVLISSGSSLKVLLRNSIRPDFHCNLERAKSILERHEELIDEFKAIDDIYAVMTTTIWPGIDKFFKGTISFFRPALSPLAIFCEDAEQVLNNEGPQVTNTAFAFASLIGASEIHLLGVDLGAQSRLEVRAKEAWKGIRPRKLEIPVRGTRGITVFTDQALIQQRFTLEAQIRMLKGVSVFNLGDGVKIAGAITADIKDINLPLIDNRKQIVDDLYSQFPTYTLEKFKANWEASAPRDLIAVFFRRLRGRLESLVKFDETFINGIEADMLYVNKTVKNQFAPRLLRGSLLKIVMMGYSVYRRSDDNDAEKIVQIFKECFGRELNLIESECYSLLDNLELTAPNLFHG